MHGMMLSLAMWHCSPLSWTEEGFQPLGRLSCCLLAGPALPAPGQVGHQGGALGLARHSAERQSCLLLGGGSGGSAGGCCDTAAAHDDEEKSKIQLFKIHIEILKKSK